MNINHLVMLTAVAVAVSMVSCIKDEVVDAPSFHPTESELIAFGVSGWGDMEDITRGGASRDRIGNLHLKSDDGALDLPVGIYVEDGFSNIADTRGATIATNDVASFNVWASLTGESGGTTFFFPEEGVVFSKDVNTFESQEAYFWPGTGTIDFVAVANAPASGFDAVVTDNKVTGFTYEVPTDATAQNDIVVASKTGVSGSNNETVPLQFKHIMSAVQVKVGTMPTVGGTIESITLKNVYNSGTYTLADGTWARGGTKSDYVVLNQSYTPVNGATINTGVNTLMMIPQTLPDDAILEVKFKYAGATEATTLTAPIAKDADGAYYEWKRSKTTFYTISIDENYNLTVVPQGNVLDAHYIMTTATVNVTELGQGETWYIKVSAEGIPTGGENVSILLNDNSVNQYIKDGYWINALDGDTEVVRGSQIYDKGTSTGAYDFIIFIPENISASDRKITLEYGIVGNEGNAKYEYLYQKCPYWDATNKWGWEKVDDQNSGQYGFDWTRKACYMFAYKIGGLQNSADGYAIYTEDWIRNLINELVTAYGAEDFVTIDTFTHKVYEQQLVNTSTGWIPTLEYVWDWYDDGSRAAVIIDYTLLNFDDAFSSTDGLGNTKAFFDARSLLAFEEALSTFKKYGEGGNAFRMLTDDEFNSKKFYFGSYTYADPTTGASTNAMFREFGEIDDASGILKYIIQRNAYDIVSYTLDNGSTGTTLDMNSEKIKWYLPAYGQFTNYDGFEFATGVATFIPAEFWSSTAAVNNQAYTGGGVPIDRSEKRKVIVQRAVEEVPTAVAVTVDNSSMAGGENGEAIWSE